MESNIKYLAVGRPSDTQLVATFSNDKSLKDKVTPTLAQTRSHRNSYQPRGFRLDNSRSLRNGRLVHHK